MRAGGSADRRKHLARQLRAVGRLQGRDDDTDDQLVAVELLELDVGRVSRGDLERACQEILDVLWSRFGAEAGAQVNALGSRSGITATFRSMLFGTIIRSAPLTRSV